MKPLGTYLPGNVLPTVVVATVLMLAGIAGLLALWEHETLLFARSCRLAAARADAESAYALYRLYPRARNLPAVVGTCFTTPCLYRAFLSKSAHGGCMKRLR